MLPAVGCGLASRQESLGTNVVMDQGQMLDCRSGLADELRTASVVGVGRLWCTDVRCGRARTQRPQPRFALCDADIVRASELKHPVQGVCSDGNLDRLSLISARSKCITDHVLIAIDRRLDFSPLIVAAGFLLGHPTALCNGPGWRSRCAGAVSAEALGAAVARGGTVTAAFG
jgi:hypothetical protein